VSISKDDFYLWKSEPITQAIFEACALRIEDGKTTLAGQAGLDPIFDSYVRGIIKAYSEILNITVEDIEEE
jgi:hypothetical protein